jgi:hypothetical protein
VLLQLGHTIELRAEILRLFLPFLEHLIVQDDDQQDDRAEPAKHDVEERHAEGRRQSSLHGPTRSIAVSFSDAE